MKSFLGCFLLCLSSGLQHYDPPFETRVGDAIGTRINLTDAAVNDGAVCIDGSHGVYYLATATSDASKNKWIVYFEGGGWCSSNEQKSGQGFNSCLDRSTSTLGSSKTYPATMDMGSANQLSADETQNPLMYDWNKAYLKYCDGASFGGNRDKPQNVTDSGTVVPLYSRGHRILKAVYNDLLTNRGMNNASDIVISGCSAGGLATWLHADWINDNLLQGTVPSDCRVSALPDSGHFIDYNGYKGSTNYSGGMEWVFNNGNMSYGSVDSDCINAYGGPDSADAYNCVFAQNIAPYVDLPLFALNSRFDAWQTSNILGSTNATLINEFGANFTDIINTNFFEKNDASNNNGHAAYIDSCLHHCGDWDALHNDNYTQATAHYAFYQGKVVGGKQNEYIWFQNDTYPCTDCCN